MAMTGFICHDDYLKKTEKLADEELGRLFRACMTYHANGELINLTGRESVAFDFIKEDIDRAEQAYTNKCEQNRRNRNARNDNNRQRPSTSVNERTQEQEQEQEQKQNNLVVVVKGDGGGFDPLELTESDIHASITRDQQIEDAARDVGLTTSTKAMMKARDLADQYGIEEVIKAIGLSVDAPRWSYVEGILKNRGDKKHGRSINNGKSDESPYAFLHGRETAVQM